MKNISLPLLLCLFISCGTIDYDVETQKVLELHHAQRDYHFNGNAEGFARQLLPDFISVNRGLVNTPTFEENLKRYSSYFQGVKFLKWDDKEAPIIRFSEDGSLAYTVVQKTVEVKYPSSEGDSIIGRTDFAWVTLYRKTVAGWKIECVASTNQPDEYPPGKEERLKMRMAQLEKAFIEADTSQLSHLITSNYRHTNGSNSPIGRQAWLEYVASRKERLEKDSMEIVSYNTSDVNINMLENAAIVNAKVTVEQVLGDSTQQNVYQVTHVWEDAHGLWKRVAFHDGKVE